MKETIIASQEQTFFEEALDLLDSEFENSLSVKEQLHLYGLYKRITVGQPPPDAPSILNQKAYQKYQAWVKHAELSKEHAQYQYVDFCRTKAASNHNENLRVKLEALLSRATRSGEIADVTVCDGDEIPGPSSSLLAKALRRVGVHPLIPRGNLDISNSDLLFALQQCMVAKNTRMWEDKIRNLYPGQSSLVGLSVRSLLDLYLRVKQFPPGSEIIVSPPINVPGMLKVLDHHRIKVVGVDLPAPDTIAVDMDQIEASFTKHTVAILVVHVFGMMVASDSDMKRLRKMADQRSIEILEDCAECYAGDKYMGSPYADLSFFSFGTIKTASTLQGGLVLGSHKSSVIDDMRQLQDSCYVQQRNRDFLWRVLKCCMLCVMADSDWTMGIVYLVLSTFFDFDRAMTWLVRGYGKKQMQQIRRKPSPALLALLHRRLSQSSAVGRFIDQKIRVCEEVKEKLVDRYSFPKTRDGLRNNYWLFPVLSDEPELVSRQLRKRGLDATRGATQLCTVTDGCPRADATMRQVFYLPIGGLRQRGTAEYRSTNWLLRPLQSLDTAKLPKQQFGGSGFSKTGLGFLVLVLLLICIPKMGRLCVVLAVSHGLSLVSGTFALLLLFVILLQWLCSDYYLSSSTLFAKYSSLIEKQLAADTHSEAATATVLSSIKALDFPAPTNETRAVFLTGATGFVGSMILRDLLVHRKTLQLRRVILLCRSKRGETATERIDELLNRDMFSFLSEKDKQSVVEVVEGCVESPNAGVSNADILKTKSRGAITHVVHCAANVNFTMILPKAARANISSALNMQSLASKLNKDARFVYISTAFVHGGQSGSKGEPLSEELFSFGRFDPEEIYKSMLGTQFYASKAMRELCFPNAYTFSKSVCENLLVKNDPDVVIIRPSIVGPALASPYEGWAGTAPSTLVAAACLFMGYQFNLWSLGPRRVPVIPVDVVSRFVIKKIFDDFANREQETLSDDTSFGNDFETISKTSSKFSSPRSSPANTVINRKYRVFNAAWNVDSGDSASFTWIDFAGAIAQVGSVLGHFGRLTASIAMSFQCRLLPLADFSIPAFEALHRCVVLYPFRVLIRVLRLFGGNTTELERLFNFLDLPLLFYPFTSSEFCFESELTAPPVLEGERYLFSCVVAAHAFVKKIHERSAAHSGKQPQLDDRLSNLPISGSSWRTAPPSLLWALSQPRGNFLIRVVGWLLGRILHLCYEEITVDVASFATLRNELETLDSGVVVLAPTHRSVFDFLLISYVCFVLPELQVKLPRIAAATEFKKLPFVGFFVQYLGAFFVQRGRIEADPTLAKTIRALSTEGNESGFSLEVFIEGKRSRDRRFVKPKTGILRLLLDSVGKYVISPIAISYERIAEQENLVSEASGQGSTGLGLVGMISWVISAMGGKIELGRVHISAGIPIVVNTEREIDWSGLANTIQKRQANAIVVSDYHINAAAKLFGIEADVVHKLMTSIGAKPFPILSAEKVSSPKLPDSESELLSIFFQTSHLWAPLLQTQHPEWASWLCPFDNIVPESSSELLMLAKRLHRLIETAEGCVLSSKSHLNEKGFSEPTIQHIMKFARSTNDRTLELLLYAAAIRHCPVVASSRSALCDSLTHIPIIEHCQLRSDENLGFWGFKDSLFVVRVDGNGDPFVCMESDRYSLKGKKICKLLKFIEDTTEVKVDLFDEAFSSPKNLDYYSESQIEQSDIRLLESLVSEASTLDEERIRHGTGHAQEDVFAIRQGLSIRVPDAVVWPATETEVAALIEFARDKDWCIIPFGGGTNVSQATRCPSLEVEPRPILSVDMRNMKKILWLNEIDGIAHIEAGITGLELEEELSLRGCTMGHEPDSIEFSTLGGWIATNASGMKRNKYGNIEDIVRSVRVVGHNGLLHHGPEGKHAWGRESCGVDICNLAFGSEGCLGIITSAVVRIWQVAEEKDYDGMLFPDFDSGLAFTRQVAKLEGLIPVSVRLLDNLHFRLGMSLRPADQSLKTGISKTLLGLYSQFVSRLDEKQVVCATILYEGTQKQVREQKRAIKQLAKQYSGLSLGYDAGKRSYDLTFMIAYLRDFALTYYFIGESFETFAPWSQISSIIEATKQTVVDEHTKRALPGKPFVCVRVTQLYHEGACLYFYFCMNFRGVSNPSQVYSDIEHAARATILKCGGSLSHHHGIGKVRACFVDSVDSRAIRDAAKNIKASLDPNNLFGARNGSFA